jgi:ATP-dependent Zn protease
MTTSTPLVAATPGAFVDAVSAIPGPREVKESWDAGQFTYEAKGIASANTTMPGDTATPTSSTGSLDQRDHILRGVVPGPAREELLTTLQTKGFTVVATQSAPLQVTSLTPSTDIHKELTYPMARTILTIGLIVAGIAYLARRVKAAGLIAMPGGTNRGSVVKDRPTQRFSDIGGCNELLEELGDVVAAARDFQQGKSGARLIKGILVHGEPGTGKTLAARALAGESDSAFVSFNSGDLSTELYVGSGLRAVRQAFELARKERDAKTAELRKSNPKAQGVCFVFLDEFDTIGRKRGEIDGGGDREAANIVNAILAEMDNLDQERNKGIVVVAATNKLKEIDPALLRPGRFARKIHVPLPETTADRIDVMRKLTPSIVTDRGLSFDSDQSLEKIAKISPRKSGDDLREILSISAELAVSDNRTTITYQDLFEAYQRQMFGRVKKIAVSEHARNLVAHHENGHALAALACGIDIMLISMMPRGESLGRVVAEPAVDSEVLPSKQDILAKILISAGGRAEERLMFGELKTTTGAFGDIQNVRSLVRAMVSTGLLGDHYAVDLLDGGKNELTPKHIELIDTIARRAFNAAEQLLTSLGKERLELIVGQLKKLDRELVGPDATNFYRSLLTAEELKKLSEIAEAFFADPLGVSGERRTSEVNAEVVPKVA